MTAKQTLLQIMRKLYIWVCGDTKDKYLDRGIKDPDLASDLIYEILTSNEPCMIARFGAFELETVKNYLDIHAEKKSIIRYIRGKQGRWWWSESLLEHLQNNAGFFPSTADNVEKFCALMIDCSKDVDILGSWQKQEELLIPYMGMFKKVWLQLLEPYWAKNPWTRALEGKRVLVVHPFAYLMENQYKEKREVLFSNSQVLPEFKFLPLPAVQSIGGESNGFNDWFDALDYMKQKMDTIDYDIALIGCGAYGFPLASHAKRTGHKAVHLAGALQLLFGIKGKRWEDPLYGARYLLPKGSYPSLFNENWVYPGDGLKPKKAESVENSCYW